MTWLESKSESSPFRNGDGSSSVVFAFRSYSSVRHRLRDTSAKNLPRHEYHPEFAGRMIGPVRTSTAFIPNAFFGATHAVYDEPNRLYDIYSPWSWPYAYQDSREIRKDPDIQGTRAVVPIYKNRVRDFANSQSRVSRYYAGEVDHYFDDADRATDAYLRWSLGVESGSTPSYRRRTDSGLLPRLGFHKPSLMERYMRSPWK